MTRLLEWRSLRARLMALALGSSFSALLLTAGAFVLYDRYSFSSLTAARLRVQTRIVGQNVLSALLFADPAAATSTLGALSEDPSILTARVFSPDGTIFASYVRPDLGATWVPAAGILVPSGLEVIFETHEGQPEVLVADRIDAAQGILGFVRIRASLQEVNARLWRQVSIAAGILLVSALVALAVAYPLQRSISGPITHLVKTTSAIASGKDYSLRASAETADELGLLVRAFNEMLEQIELKDAQIRADQSALERRVEERTGQLQEANAELEAFSYSVSHDLRAPLRAILGFSQALIEDHAAALGPEAIRLLGVVQSNAKKMSALIDDLLELSRLGRRAIHPSEVDVSALAQIVLDEILENAPSERAVHMSAPPLPKAWADAPLLRIVLMNLLSNAIKYSRKGEETSITIGASPFQGGGTEYSVSDKGAGFDMRYVGKLFGVFQRLHLAEEYSGTGVGLATVARIVRRHDGQVRAYSPGVGQGATFFFSIPDRKGAEP